MMKLLTLSLLLSSLVAAGFLSPPPESNPQIREGHRIFVVEYERELPPQSSSSPPVSGDLSENFKDAASDFSRSSEEKISSLTTKTKDKAVQLEESSADAVKAVSDKAKGTGEEVAAATKKSVNQAEATAAKLEENLMDIMKRGRDLWRDFMVHVAAAVRTAARSSAAVAHLLGFATAFGTCVWVTFVSSHVLASALPRQQFGIVQSRIYPVYFGAVGFGVGAAVIAFFIGSGWRTAAEKAQGYNLLGVLGMTMINMLYLEPRATKTEHIAATRDIFQPYFGAVDDHPLQGCVDRYELICRDLDERVHIGDTYYGSVPTEGVTHHDWSVGPSTYADSGPSTYADADPSTYQPTYESQPPIFQS